MAMWIKQIPSSQTASDEHWDLFIHSPLAGAETRCGRSQAWVPHSVPRLEVACLSNTDLTFSLRFESQGLSQSWSLLSWCDIGSKLDTVISTLAERSNAQLKVLADLSEGGWEIAFFLFSSLLDNPQINFSALFTAPKSYPQAKDTCSHPPIDTWGIRQPPAFLSTWTEQFQGIPKVSHVFLLGFDPERPNKFIAEYNWDTTREVKAIIGDPPFVSGGIADAKCANARLLQELERVSDGSTKIFSLPANNPFDVADWLQSEFSTVDYLDIIPIGTTPMLIGATLFYFGTPEEKKDNIRILHDFPRPRSGRTEGVGDSWLYRISDYLNRYK